MNHKKKLLFTMGCSFTEGIGCYDMDTIPKYLLEYPKKKMGKFLYTDIKNGKALYKRLYDLNKDRFHEYSWPNHLGRLLNYDKVINTGMGGTSTSGQLKTFIENFKNENFDEYDVTVVWLLTEPIRISFYREGNIADVGWWAAEATEETFDYGSLADRDYQLQRAYTMFVDDLSLDPTLEQIFYVKCFEEICENRNWNLLIQHWNTMHGDAFKSLYTSKYMMNEDKNFSAIDYRKIHQSPICYHLNEKGYQIMAERMFGSIQKHHSNLINKNTVEKFEWQHLGRKLNKDYNKKLL